MEHLEFPQTQTTESVLSIARISQITYPAGDPGVYNRDVKRKRRYPRVVRKSRNVGKLRACAHSVYQASLSLYGRPGNEARSLCACLSVILSMPLSPGYREPPAHALDYYYIPIQIVC